MAPPVPQHVSIDDVPALRTRGGAVPTSVAAPDLARTPPVVPPTTPPRVLIFFVSQDGQVAVGPGPGNNGAVAPNVASALEVQSSIGGLTFPGGTTAQRNAIPVDASTRTFFFNTTTQTVDFYNGTAWVQTSMSIAVSIPKVPLTIVERDAASKINVAGISDGGAGGLTVQGQSVTTTASAGAIQNISFGAFVVTCDNVQETAATGCTQTATTGNINRTANTGNIIDRALAGQANRSAGTSITDDAATTVSITGGTGAIVSATANNLQLSAPADKVMVNESNGFRVETTNVLGGSVQFTFGGSFALELQTNKVGFFGVSPVVRPAAYTLAGGATRTFPAISAAFLGIDNAQVGLVYAQVSDLNSVATQVNDLEGVVRQIVADLTLLGLLQ